MTREELRPLEKVQKGDHVLIVGCVEEMVHTNTVFVAISDPWLVGEETVIELAFSESGEEYTPFGVRFLRVIPKDYRRAPAPLRRWTASDGVPPNGFYWVESKDACAIYPVKDGFVHAPREINLIPLRALYSQGIWLTGAQPRPIEAEGGAE